MKKFLDGRTKPVKYILTSDNKLQQLTSLADFTMESKEIPMLGMRSELLCKASKELLNAASDGDLDLVKKIVQDGNGSMFPTDCLGTSPLHLAAQYNHIQICQYLLQCGFVKDLKNKLDKTPLHLAAFVGNYKIVEIFIGVGANVNCQDMLHMTPLHWAVQYRHTEIVELLLKSGASTEFKNKFGLTPHDIAVQINKREIIELLQAHLLVIQLDTENQNLQKVIENEDHETDQIEVIDANNDCQIDNQQNINNEPMIVNLCDTADEYSQDIQNKDPVIIDLDNENDEKLPVITGKSNKFTNLKIVNGVIQPSEEESDNRLSAIQLLQEHGITMLQNDNEENNILSAAMESGHSFVLTEVGKQVFKTVKQKQEHAPIDRTNKIITVTPEQFLALSNGNLRKKNTQPRQLNFNRQPGILRKTRVTPFSNMIKNQKPIKPKTEVQILHEKLNKAYQTIAEYKMKLKSKQEEVDRYKLQLKLFATYSPGESDIL
ncbi:unnamed protein product [Ceutorhynchus assimilis]|uniref:Uncharacterized protein n=1 Tax=Ceutorhynchus assimilis TaxID=467358 RepID=A0A9N9MSD1_9CUCU|nr:unnamed protein product [Ceutorhynchus assimilis]